MAVIGIFRRIIWPALDPTILADPIVEGIHMVVVVLLVGFGFVLMAIYFATKALLEKGNDRVESDQIDEGQTSATSQDPSGRR